MQYLKEGKSQAFDYASERYSLFKTIETLRNFTPGSRPWSRVWKKVENGLQQYEPTSRMTYEGFLALDWGKAVIEWEARWAAVDAKKEKGKK